MFERFTEQARRSVFFARYRTSERDGDEVTSEDLLGGLLLAAPDAVLRFALTDAVRPTETGEEFLRRAERNRASWASTSREIPFSAAAKLVMERAVEEANALGHKFVRPEHLLLVLLRDEGTDAWRTLHEAGVSLREVTRILGAEGDTGEPPFDWDSER